MSRPRLQRDWTIVGRNRVPFEARGSFLHAVDRLRWVTYKRLNYWVDERLMLVPQIGCNYHLPRPQQVAIGRWRTGDLYGYQCVTDEGNAGLFLLFENKEFCPVLVTLEPFETVEHSRRNHARRAARNKRR